MVSIEEVRREKKTVYVHLSDGQRIKLPLALYRERPLQPGEEIDVQAFDEWLMPRQYRFALERAVSYLAARACSRKEIEEKLLRVGYRPCTVEMVLYKLERERLLDDADFARQWTESRANHRLGPARIRQELRRKGITEEDAREALSQLDQESLTEATAELVRR